MRDSFMFFRNMRDIIKTVPRDLQLELREAIEDYVFDGKEPTDWAFKAIIQSIKPSLEYIGRGAPKGNQNAKKEVEDPLTHSSDDEARDDTYCLNKNNSKQKNQINGIDLIETKKQEAKAETKEETETKDKKNNLTVITKNQNFKKPTIDEIDTYCRESENYIDVGRFYDFYESKGWKVGKSPMKDWRAAVRNWARSQKPAPASRKTADDDVFGVSKPERHEWTDEELDSVFGGC